MLIRKAVFSASVFSSLFGVSQADAGLFGRRNCCQATPVACPPCAAPAPKMSSFSIMHPLHSYSVPTVRNAGSFACPSPAFGSAPVVMQSIGPTISQMYEETYSVQVPYTKQKTIIENGQPKTVTITEMRT